MSRSVRIAMWLGSVLMAFALGTVLGETAPPAQSKGVRISQPLMLDLGPWADDMKGRQLRIRKFEIEPGGVIAVHSHDDRPDVSYLVQGQLTEFRAGGFTQPRAADTFHEAGKGVTHWQENTGTTPAVLIVADIFKAP